MTDSATDGAAPAETRLSLGALLLHLLAAVALVVLCGGVVVFGGKLLLGPAPTVVEGEPWPLRVWLTYVALAFATAAAYGLYRRLVARRPVRALALGPAPGEIATGAAVGVGAAALITLLLAVTGCYHVAGWRSPAALAAPGLMALGAGVLEETVARGFILGLVERWAGSRVALAASSILFAAAHLGNGGVGLWPVVALTIGAGWSLGAAYLATGRLWLPIALHFGWNFGQSALFDLPDSGTNFQSLIDARITGPDWLTGAAFGPEASLPGLALWVTLGVLFYARAQRRGRLVPWRR